MSLTPSPLLRRVAELGADFAEAPDRAERLAERALRRGELLHRVHLIAARRDAGRVHQAGKRRPVEVGLLGARAERRHELRHRRQRVHARRGRQRQIEALQQPTLLLSVLFTTYTNQSIRIYVFETGFGVSAASCRRDLRMKFSFANSRQSETFLLGPEQANGARS